MSLNFHRILSSSELFAKLRGINISVPRRIDGRTTDHTETWIIARLLATLAKGSCFTFPLSVTHRDRPDILVQAGDLKIGVEITEAITTQFAKYCALAEREFPNKLIDPGHFHWGAPDLTVEQMRELLRQNQLTADSCSVGDYPEREWARYIQSIVDSKLLKLASANFAKFDQNWLAIYDNLPPNIGLDIDKAITFLEPLLRDRWLQTPRFDTLFVEHERVIARITAEGSECLCLNDLWEKGDH